MRAFTSLESIYLAELFDDLNLDQVGTPEDETGDFKPLAFLVAISGSILNARHDLIPKPTRKTSFRA